MSESKLFTCESCGGSFVAELMSKEHSEYCQDCHEELKDEGLFDE